MENEWTTPDPAEGWQEIAPGMFCIKDAKGVVTATKWSPERVEIMKAARLKAKARPQDAAELGRLLILGSKPDATEEERTSAREALLTALAGEIVAGGARAVSAIQTAGNALGPLFKEKAPEPKPSRIELDPGCWLWLQSLWEDNPQMKAWLEDASEKWAGEHGQPKAR